MSSTTQYTPANCGDFVAIGSTSLIWKHATRPNVVIKAPATRWWELDEDRNAPQKFSTEIKILEILGEHKNIVRYLGPLDPSEPTRELLLGEAANGSLQKYLNTHGDEIDIQQRLQWCKNVVEGLAYCHKLDVLHCDLRPDNLLVDKDLNIRICDFGGSNCGDIDGAGLPDFGFFDPRDEDIYTVTESTEIFGLGSIMYFIMTGNLPHGPSTVINLEASTAYDENFQHLVRQGIFPDTRDIRGGEIILDCWAKKGTSAKDVLARLLLLNES